MGHFAHAYTLHTPTHVHMVHSGLHVAHVYFLMTVTVVAQTIPHTWSTIASHGYPVLPCELYDYATAQKDVRF